MSIHRRALLGAVGAAVAAGSAGAQTPTATPAPAPSADQRITERALENRYRLEYDGATFSGPAWDFLAREGAAAEAFLIGEEHGVAENPKLAAQLFRTLRPSGYEKVCVEISPAMAEELDRAARGGVDEVRRLVQTPGSYLAFFGMREEAEWIADARAQAPDRGQAIWGLDYDVGADRRLIARLKAKRKPRAAETALEALEAASSAAWAQYDQTRGPQFIFNFSGDPALVRVVRGAWPRADEDAILILDTLEETLEINRLWVQGDGWASNRRRADFNKRNLLRYRREQSGGRVFYKFGASHMVRGLSHTLSFDIGTLVPELAALDGGHSFHLLVIPGEGRPHAQLDPTAFVYRSVVADGYNGGLAPLITAAYADAFTLIDLRPLRPTAHAGRVGVLNSELVRTIHGFDAVLVMSGSNASANL